MCLSGAGGYDSSRDFRLCKALPRLESLQLVDVPFKEVRLTQALTPNVKNLRMQNIGDECDLEVVLPKLRDVTIHFYRPDSGLDDDGGSPVIDAMLAAATKLRTFDSYKLWLGSLSFASNSLKSIDLHRSDSLGRLKIWAPNLESLGLQACYRLERWGCYKVHSVYTLC